MNYSLVNIDYMAMAKALSKHIREKAAHSNSTIIYLKNGAIIEEDPKNNTKSILKQSLSSKAK